MSNENSRNGTDNSLYVRDGIILIPYSEVNGARTIPDEEIYQAFEIMKNERTLDIVHYDQKIETPEDFIDLVKRPGNLFSFFYDEKEMLGMGWVNGVSKTHAFAHFCTFKKSWGDRSVLMGKMALDYWMSFDDGEPLFNVIIGMIPSFNKRAIQYIQKLGFVTLGDIPKMANVDGNKEPMTINYYVR